MTGKRALIVGIYPDRPDARNFIMKILPSGHFTTYHNSVLQKIVTMKKITKGDFTLELI
jgi:hypothetical protein